MAYVTPCIICVQYIGDVQYIGVHRGDIMSTSEDAQHIRGIS